MDSHSRVLVVDYDVRIMHMSCRLETSWCNGNEKQTREYEAELKMDYYV